MVEMVWFGFRLFAHFVPQKFLMKNDALARLPPSSLLPPLLHQLSRCNSNGSCFVVFCFWKIFNLPASSGAQIGKMPWPGLEQRYRILRVLATTKWQWQRQRPNIINENQYINSRHI